MSLNLGTTRRLVGFWSDSIQHTIWWDSHLLICELVCWLQVILVVALLALEETQYMDVKPACGMLTWAVLAVNWGFLVIERLVRALCWVFRIFFTAGHQVVMSVDRLWFVWSRARCILCLLYDEGGITNYRRTHRGSWRHASVSGQLVLQYQWEEHP